MPPMKRGAAFLASLGLTFMAAPAQADPGDLVTSFGTAGIFASSFQTQFPSDRHQEAAIDSQGRIVLAATRVDAQNHEHLEVLRVTPHGDLDTSFGQGGVVDVTSRTKPRGGPVRTSRRAASPSSRAARSSRSA